MSIVASDNVGGKGIGGFGTNSDRNAPTVLPLVYRKKLSTMAYKLTGLAHLYT